MSAVISKPTHKILLLDDQSQVCSSFERLVEKMNPDVRVNSVTSAEKAEQRLKDNEYTLVFVDLRLSSTDSEGGLNFLENNYSRYPQSTFILFTSNPFDPIIEQKIDTIHEKAANFPIFVKDKGDVTTLAHLIQEFIQSQTDLIDFSIIPQDLLIEIERVERQLWSKTNEVIYEYGRLFSIAKEKIEACRKKLNQQIEALEKAGLKAKKDQTQHKFLTQQLEEIGKLWTSYLAKKVGFSESTIARNMNYYEYISRVGKEYLAYLDPSVQAELTRKTSKGRSASSTYVLSEEDEKYLLETAKTSGLKGVEVKRYLKLKKKNPFLAPPLLYQLSLESDETIGKLLSSPDFQNVETAQILEKLVQKASKHNLTEVFEKALSPSPPSAQWHYYQYYAQFHGNWSDALAALPKDKTINYGIVEQDSADIQMIKEFLRRDAQFSSLKTEDWSNFVQFFQELIYQINYTISEENEIIILLISQEYCQEIDKIIKSWQKAQTNQSLPEDEREYFQTICQFLAKRTTLFIICQN